MHGFTKDGCFGGGGFTHRRRLKLKGSSTEQEILNHYGKKGARVPQGKRDEDNFLGELGAGAQSPAARTILMRMNTPKRELSPSDFAEETGEHLSNASYHFRQLSRYGLIRETRTAQVRGATEHFYEPVKRAMAWTATYGAMPDAVKQSLAASAAAGRGAERRDSIDAGTFDAREDSHLSYDQMRVDAKGWEQIIAVFNQALLDAIAIRDEALERLAGDDAETFFASYLLSCWEAAPPDHPTPCGGYLLTAPFHPARLLSPCPSSSCAGSRAGRDAGAAAGLLRRRLPGDAPRSGKAAQAKASRSDR